MIGIIGAMDEEVAILKESMEVQDTMERAGMTFVKGIMSGKEVVVVRSGIGKVNMGICAQILIDCFGVDTLINTGVAGSLDADINIGDIVISTDAVQHDMDVSMLGDPVGQIPRMDTFSFPADEKLVKLAVEVNKEVNPDIQTFTGRVLSGDQFISGKEKTVEEFLHTFDELFHAHKTIVICADAAACDISNLDPRLAARLESGLTVELNLPDDNARLEILRSKRDRAGMNVSDEILEFLASRIQKSVRRLEGALLRVATFTSLSGDMPDIAKIEQVATISANNDETIGKLIAEAMAKVNNEGVITVEEAKGTETHVEVVEGMQFDRGYISAYFMTDPEKMEAQLEKPYILITDKKISTMKELMGVLEPVAQSGRSLLIIAEDVDGEALSALVVNKLRGTLKIAACKAPGFGDRRKEMLEDIAILTGATVISTDKGMKMEDTDLTMLGTADKVTLNKENTTIVDGAGKKEEIAARVAQIRSSIDKATSDYDKEKLQERLAKLAGGVAVLYVGAATEVEMKEKKDRVDDALAATRAAVEEGIVPGGGVAYIRATAALEGMKGANEDQTTGIQIVKRAIEEPLRQIVENAGGEGSVVVNKVKEGKDAFGYNARDDKYEDLLKAGIIDPTKVSRVALENAASIASMFLTTECVLAEKKSDAPAMPAMPAGGMGGMM